MLSRGRGRSAPVIFDAEQEFTLPFPGGEAEALAFLRDPGRSLRAMPLLRGLSFDGQTVRAELVVQVPMFGELALPFASDVLPVNGGAELRPHTLSGRAWAEVAGQGRARAGELFYHFHFRAHLTLPAAEKWGGAAFEKMFQAAARRTLDRVAREFPAGVRAALPQNG